MKPKGPKDLLYLTILSGMVSGLVTGGLLIGWWIFQNLGVWVAIFYAGFVITWLWEVGHDE